MSDPSSLKNIKNILWDVDGTLFSSEGIIHQIYQDVFQAYRARHGVPRRAPTLPEILDQIGKPVKTIFENLAPDLSDEQRSQIGLSILHGLVQAITSGLGEHYADVRAVLEALHGRGYRFFAASNGRFPYIEAILRSNATLPLFTDVRTVDNRLIHNKVDLVRSILTDYQLLPAETVLIGDRKSDSEGAAQNGLAFIACAFGHGAPEEWDRPVVVLHSLRELLDILK